MAIQNQETKRLNRIVQARRRTEALRQGCGQWQPSRPSLLPRVRHANLLVGHCESGMDQYPIGMCPPTRTTQTIFTDLVSLGYAMVT